MDGHNDVANDVKVEVKEEVEGEDEDPVVHEIPVYLSKGVDCYLFQYPVRPASMPYDTADILASRIRPINKQVELEIGLNTNSPNYDRSKGEQIVLNTEGGQAGDNTVMDKQVLAGRAAGCSTGRYAIAVLDNNELHLTALRDILQLRPSLQHLDRADKRLAGRGAGQGEEEQPAQAVTVRFARGDAERSKKYQEKNFDYQMKKAEEEEWVDCEFHQMRTGDWEEVTQQMFCQAMETQVPTLSAEPAQYLADLRGERR